MKGCNLTDIIVTSRQDTRCIDLVVSLSVGPRLSQKCDLSKFQLAVNEAEINQMLFFLLERVQVWFAQITVHRQRSRLIRLILPANRRD